MLEHWTKWVLFKAKCIRKYIHLRSLYSDGQSLRKYFREKTQRLLEPVLSVSLGILGKKDVLSVRPSL